jgi:hypothetical protein
MQLIGVGVEAGAQVLVCSHVSDARDGFFVDSFQDLQHVGLEGMFIKVKL